MSQLNTTVVSRESSEGASLVTYVSGFILSMVLTLATYLTVVRHLMNGRQLVAFIISLALIQFLVQLFFFMHLGKETKPRWKLLVLVFMILVVSVLVLGSIWIMYNLNYNMTPQQMNKYLLQQDGGI